MIPFAIPSGLLYERGGPPIWVNVYQSMLIGLVLGLLYSQLGDAG